MNSDEKLGPRVTYYSADQKNRWSLAGASKIFVLLFKFKCFFSKKAKRKADSSLND